MGLTDCTEAGEADMVLSLFLARSDPVGFFAEDVIGRVLSVLVGRELFVVVLNAGLTVVPAPDLSDAGLLSEIVVDAIVDLRPPDDAADDRAGRTGDRVAAVPIVAIRLATKLVEDLEFSSEPLATPFLPSSIEFIEDLCLWPTLGALVAVTFVAGRRVPEVIVGRAGGLLSPLTGSIREVDEAVDVVAGLGVDIDVDVRFAAVKGRFGGIPFLGGDFCAA